MSDESMVRTTVSIDHDIYSEARARMKALRIRKFSAYVALLIERDIRVRGSITVVKEEAVGEYKPKQPASEPTTGPTDPHPKTSRGVAGISRAIFVAAAHFSGIGIPDLFEYFRSSGFC